MKKISTGEWDGVITTTTTAVSYFNRISNLPHRIDYTRDRIMPTIAVFYFKKHSPGVVMFDEKIDMLTEAGLINRWLIEYNYEKKNHKNKRANRLTITNISAILKITIFMYLISACVFILELLSERRRLIKRFLDYLTY